MMSLNLQQKYKIKINKRERKHLTRDKACTHKQK